MTDAPNEVVVPEGQIPQYRLLANSFFAPKYLLAGSIVETHAPPGNHMQPLNPAAEDRMEKWYHEEFDEFDDKGKKTGQKVKPHLKFRIQRFEPGVVHAVNVIAEPRPDDMTNSLSLAGAAANVRPDTDQRPGPAAVPEAAPVSEAEAVKEQTGAAVIEAAPQTDARKAGVKVT
jgi:hypothetical protein